jgi:hypothetical protein
MSGATIEQVNLMLKLYDARREAKLRDARDWYAANFHPQSVEEAMKLCPPGTQQNTYMRMVIGYWEMVASIANRGLIDEELFFENSGEMWVVWEQLKPTIAGWRETFGSKHVMDNLEKCCGRFEAWREKRDPGVNAKTRNFFAQLNAAAKAGKSQAAAS